MKLIFGIFLIALTSGAAETPTPKSTHLKNFEITQCHGSDCFQVRGKIGFLSQGSLFLSAKDVTLNLKSQQTTTTCEGLRYDMLSQYLICDNQDSKKLPSITIDDHFTIEKY